MVQAETEPVLSREDTERIYDELSCLEPEQLLIDYLKQPSLHRLQISTNVARDQLNAAKELGDAKATRHYGSLHASFLRTLARQDLHLVSLDLRLD